MNSTPTSTTVIDAGSFGTWLRQAREALRGNQGMEVPCGDCVGCCTSSYSILLRPHDAALDAVPSSLLSGVSGLAYPHAKMNPLENGHCPMFKAGKCAIYSIRPQTCLDYDCRVYAAAGIEAGDNRPVINKRVREWQFTYASTADHVTHGAVKAAAQFISKHTKLFPAEFAASSPSAIAVLAIKVYGLFIGESLHSQNAMEMVKKIIGTSREFDATQIPTP